LHKLKKHNVFVNTSAGAVFDIYALAESMNSAGLTFLRVSHVGVDGYMGMSESAFMR
jgi:hypothetical protein